MFSDLRQPPSPENGIVASCKLVFPRTGEDDEWNEMLVMLGDTGRSWLKGCEGAQIGALVDHGLGLGFPGRKRR